MSKPHDLMHNKRIFFVDRRKGNDRRLDTDPCRDIPMDLYHRKRRKRVERRDTSRTLQDDYYAYMRNLMGKIQNAFEVPQPKIPPEAGR